MQNNQKTDQLEFDRDVSAVLFDEMQKISKKRCLQQKSCLKIRSINFDSKDYVTVSVYESHPDSGWRILLSHPLFLRILWVPQV